MSLGTVGAQSYLQTGLVGWYRMLGNANDSSGRGNTGTAVGSPTLVADKYGNANGAYSFNGTSQWVPLTQTSGQGIYSQSNPYSIAFWIKAPANNGYVYAEADPTGVAGTRLFGLRGSGAVMSGYLRNQSGGVLLNANQIATVFDNTWHHYAWVDSYGTVACYVDGVLDSAGSTASNYPSSAIGGAFTTSTIGAIVRSSVLGHFAGSVSDVRLYNRTLTADEVGTLYRATQRI